MSKVCTDLVKLNDNSVFVGASLRIQKVIKLLQQENLGGFEFLYSLHDIIILCFNSIVIKT